MNYEDFLTHYQNAKNELGDFVVVTMTGFVGSVPQVLGARLIVGKSGYFAGTVGGGKLEKRATEVAVEFLSSETSITPFSKTINLQTELGMSCGGVATLLFEKQLRSSGWEIAIFGAGHVSQELVRVLLRLDCQLTVIDQRPEWLAKFPESRRLKTYCSEEPKNFVDELSPKTFVVVSTMGHATDLPILEKVLPLGFPYVGAIGSAVKAEKLKLNLKEASIAIEHIETLHCPIGERFGNNTPAEIALSIAAQLLRIRDKRNEK